MKILITGGPVYEHLDSVKIITNKFKGGLMSDLADRLDDLGAQVSYLHSRDSKKPEYTTGPILTHNGYSDYRNQVLDLAPNYNAVILGAAVCNLIPDTPWKNTKFPSHDYKEGDRVSIDFIVAPRIINMVKRVAPKTTLIGFKLLNDVSNETLIDAAYDVVVDSGATFVIANDAKKLNKVNIITKEKSSIPLSRPELAEFIFQAVQDEYYSSWIESEYFAIPKLNQDHYMRWVNHFSNNLTKGYDIKRNIYFGCVATRYGNGFLISPRGKNSITNAPVFVSRVDHANKVIKVSGGKASLNAPLIDKLFKKFEDASVIIHDHLIDDSLPTYQYAFPGTVRDTDRDIKHDRFNIEHHGKFIII